MAAIPADDVPYDPNRSYRAEYTEKKPLAARQPFKFFWATAAVVANAVQLPVWIIIWLLPRFRPNPNWSLQTAVVNHIVKRSLHWYGAIGVITPLSLVPGWEGKKRVEVVQPSRQNVYLDTCVDPRGVVKPVPLPGVWRPAKPAKLSADKSGAQTTILHFHGGAFVIGDPRDLYSGHLGKMLSQHVAPQIVAAGYRLSSNKEGYFPAQLQDAVTWWFHVTVELGIPAERVVLSGDSAGANLAYTLLRYMELHRDLFPVLPAAVLMWSPWTDLSSGFHADEIPAAPRFDTDYIDPNFPQWGATTMAINYPTTDPWLSPLRGVFRTQAPLFVQCGSSEILFDDINLFYRKLADAKNEVEIHVSENANHDIILLGRVMGFSKEVRAACAHAKRFVDAAVAKAK